MTRLMVVGILTSLLLVVVLVWLIRTRRLQERFALIWLAATLVVVLFGLWPAGLSWLAGLLGIGYGPSALFLVTGIFVVGMLLYLVVVITRLLTQTQTLAQRLAILEERVRRNAREAGEGE